MFKKQYLPVKARFFCADRGGENVAGAHHHTRGRGCCVGEDVCSPPHKSLTQTPPHQQSVNLAIYLFERSKILRKEWSGSSTNWRTPDKTLAILQGHFAYLL